MESYVNTDRSKYPYMEVNDWSILIDCEEKDYTMKKLHIANVTTNENSCQQQQRLQRFRRFRNQRITESLCANYIDHLHIVHVLLLSAYEDRFAKDRSLRIIAVIKIGEHLEATEEICEEVLYDISNTHLLFKSLPGHENKNGI